MKIENIQESLENIQKKLNIAIDKKNRAEIIKLNKERQSLLDTKKRIEQESDKIKNIQNTKEIINPYHIDEKEIDLKIHFNGKIFGFNKKYLLDFYKNSEKKYKCNKKLLQEKKILL